MVGQGLGPRTAPHLEGSPHPRENGPRHPKLPAIPQSVWPSLPPVLTLQLVGWLTAAKAPKLAAPGLGRCARVRGGSHGITDRARGPGYEEKGQQAQGRDAGGLRTAGAEGLQGRGRSPPDWVGLHHVR